MRRSPLVPLILFALLARAGSAGAQGAGWIDSTAHALAAAVDSGGGAPGRFAAARLSAGALKERTAAAYAQELERLRAQGGGVTLGSVEPLGSGRLVTLRARTADATTRVYLMPDASEPGRLAGIGFFGPAHRAGAIAAPAGAGQAERLRALDAEVGRLAAAGELSGVVVVAREGRVVYRRAVGTADREAARPVREGTRFHLASAGKMFTAVAVAQLVEAGRVSLDDPVSRLLPELPWSDGGRAITVRHLLSHTAGIGAADSVRRTPAGIAAMRPAFAPGTAFRYSNEGFDLLAEVVARASGEPFARYLRRRVFGPAGMRATSLDAPETLGPDVAVGYGRRDDDAFGTLPRAGAADRVRGRTGGGAGGGYATAGDMVRFATALHAGRLVSRALLDTLAAPRNGLPGVLPGERYGLGFASRDLGGRAAFGHAGGGMGWGICSALVTTADGALTVAVLTNHDPPTCEILGDAALRLLAPAAPSPRASR